MNVYTFVPGVALIALGFHVPLMPLFDVVGNAGRVEPWQIAAIGVNVAVVLLLTVTLIVVPTAH